MLISKRRKGLFSFPGQSVLHDRESLYCHALYSTFVRPPSHRKVPLFTPGFTPAVFQDPVVLWRIRIRPVCSITHQQHGVGHDIKPILFACLGMEIYTGLIVIEVVIEVIGHGQRTILHQINLHQSFVAAVKK